MSVFSVIISALRKLVDTALLIVTQILKLIFLPIRIVLYPFTAIWSSVREFYQKYYGPQMTEISFGGPPVDHNEPDMSDEGNGQLRGQVLYVLIAAFFIIAMIWASTAKIDEQVRAEGIIITPSDVQHVQSRLPGSLTEINVLLGSVVKQGDVLFRVEDEDVLANFEDNEINYISARLSEIRLEAELLGHDMPNFPDELRIKQPELVAQEQALFDSRKKALASRITVLRDAVQTLRRTITEKEAEARISTEQAALFAEEVEILTPLVENGHEPRASLLSARTRLQQALGTAELAILSAKARQSDLTGKQNEMEALIDGFKAEAASKFVEVQTQASQYLSRQQALHGKVRHAEIKAPLSGVVSAVHVKTVGAVVQAGTMLADIVPAESTLMVRAKILPLNIAAVKPGQIARISVSAYDPSRYGVIMGLVQRVATNTTQPDGQAPFYETIIEIPEMRLTKSAITPDIAAGMPLTIDILGDKRTVMDYIITPIQKSWKTAFREK